MPQELVTFGPCQATLVSETSTLDLLLPWQGLDDHSHARPGKVASSRISSSVSRDLHLAESKVEDDIWHTGSEQVFIPHLEGQSFSELSLLPLVLTAAVFFF